MSTDRLPGRARTTIGRRRGVPSGIRLHAAAIDEEPTSPALDTYQAPPDTPLGLLKSPRRAGKAELASSVLHNVGNVLNSVNISTGVAIQLLQNSKAPSLGKLVRLLEQHADDLGNFLAEDPKGRQVHGFLVMLSERLQQEHGAVLQELGLVRRNLDHIKQIVSVQQNLTGVSGLSERLRAESLVEDALRIVADALRRHDVEVVQDVAVVPAIEVDRHKAVQILVNLLCNAKFACIDAGHANKRITLRISPVANGVCITVSDNGVGITRENLPRIFRQGFTTRKEGHGFGLHSGWLAARELGGSLEAQSEGPGHGATFTLVLPLRRPGVPA